MAWRPDREFLATFPRPLLIVDGGLHVLGHSRRALAVLGVRPRTEATDPGALLEASLEEHVALGDQLALATARLRHAGDDESFTWEHAGRAYEVTVTLLQPEPPQLLVLLDDTTVSTRSEEILRNARQYLERLLDELPLGVMVLGEDLRCTSVNRRQLGFLQQMGLEFSLEQAIGAQLGEFLPGELGRSWHQQCARAAGALAPGEEVRHGYPVATGELVLATRAMPLSHPQSSETGVMLICEDITERTRLERELVRAERLATVGQMVITVNHEINNPLSIIATNAQMLRLRPSGLDERGLRRLARIEAQVQRIAEVTRRLRQMDEVATSEYIACGPDMIDLWGPGAEV